MACSGLSGGGRIAIGSRRLWVSEGRVHGKWRLTIAKSIEVSVEIVDLLLEGFYACVHGTEFATVGVSVVVIMGLW